MSLNRVQKLLFSEYCDFEDLVLLESPFAQTTKDGKGLRQVHLGLTPSKLILATDILPPIDDNDEEITPNFHQQTYCVDAEIETFELIAIYPVECVNLSIYCRKKRQALKARFCNNCVYYFELGGFERRGMFWNLWCEKVKFLSPDNSGTSRSETSVATSTSTGSSLYLIDKKIVSLNGIKQLWCKFGPNFGIDTNFIHEVVSANSQSLARKWTDRYLYLGKDFQQNNNNNNNFIEYQPIVEFPSTKEFVKPSRRKRANNKPKRAEFPCLADERNLSIGDSVQINRFGDGIMEGCKTGLFLTLDDYVVPKRLSLSTFSSDNNSIDFEEIAENAVLLWEYYSFSNNSSKKTRHRRRYGFTPKLLLLYGLGPWQVTKGDRVSLQMKRASSAVNLRSSYYNNNNGFRSSSVQKNQLISTTSHCNLLNNCEFDASNHLHHSIINNAIKKPIIFFWTPGYWYRPISACAAFKERQKLLKRIHTFHGHQSKKSKSKRYRRKFLKRFGTNKEKETDDDDDDNVELFQLKSSKKLRKHNFIFNLLGSPKIEETLSWGDERRRGETHLQHLRRILIFDPIITAWNLDSTTLAQQLTLIDKDLFLKIPPAELSNILWQQSAENAPNLAAILAFSHRVGCLISSEILRHDVERVRARLLARFINVANKCHRISNFQSCRSVLSGLQSPAIFRLKKTWAYVRKKHASKYEIFEFLCRLYRDPRMPTFQKTFFIFTQNPPYMPYIGHIIAKLFNKIPEYKVQTLQRQFSFSTTKSFKSNSSSRSIINPNNNNWNTEEVPQITMNLFTKFLRVFSNAAPQQNNGSGDAKKQSAINKNKNKKHSNKTLQFKGLYEYFKPLDDFKENRKEILIQVVELLEKCQLGAVHYNFISDNETRNFLLKSRYFNDEDNFFNSLRLESSTNNITCICRNKRK